MHEGLSRDQGRGIELTVAKRRIAGACLIGLAILGYWMLRAAGAL